ncbi:MAG TPA: DUF1585 domain-containing protein [Myxococcota bacterium]
MFARARAMLAIAPLALVWACPAPPAPKAETPAVATLTPEQHLVRVAMALRGLRPTDDELAQVRADPSAIDPIVDGWLETPEFADTIRTMHAEQFLTNVDPVFFPAGFRPLGTLASLDSQKLNTSIVESPARLAEYVVMNNRPYHEIVTGDYAVADSVTSTIFGIPYDKNGPEWQQTQYTDGRDQAGVLSDSFFFTRHASTFSNKNRGRANVVARTFLCYDFLSRQVELDSNIDLTDDDAVAHAVKENATCVSCHQTLDPLAASFSPYFPIYVPTSVDTYPFAFFQGAATSYMRTADPAYFGEPSRGIRDLGVLIAQDPRFSMCTARRFYSYFTQTEPEQVPLETVSRFNDVFLSDGMDAKQLVKAIVLSDDFRAASSNVDEGADDLRAILKARPEQLAQLVESTTGYRWQTDLPFDFGTGNIGKVDLMTDAFFGFKVLAGGTDGQGVTRPANTMNATATLAVQGLAAHAAPFVVQNDFAQSDKSARRLLTLVNANDTDEAKVRAQLVALNQRLYGEHHGPNDDVINDAYALFTSALADSGDGAQAWQIVVYAMLQDIRITYY